MVNGSPPKSSSDAVSGDTAIGITASLSAGPIAASAAAPSRSERLLERLALPVCLGFYFMSAVLNAIARPLWFDELATYYLANLPNLPALFEALRSSADAQPPLIFLVTRVSHALFGGGELATRLPSIAAFGLMSWALCDFVRRRMSLGYGIAAMLFAWMSWGYEYAYEARPYALVMALVGLSLLFWSRAAERSHRRGLLLAGLAISLVLLLSSHYYAGLLLTALGVGELVRTVRRKAIDWSIWAILGLAPFVLVLYAPFIRAVTGSYAKGFFSPPEWFDIYGFYLILLLPAFIPATIALIVAGFVAWRYCPRQAPGVVERAQTLEVHERAAVFALAAMPLLYVLFALAVTGAFVYRYALGALFGVSVVFADVVCSWLGARRLAVWSLCGVLCAGFVVLRVAPAVSGLVVPGERQEILAELAAIELLTAESSAPIAVSSPHDFFQYSHYASPVLRGRLMYLADPVLALEGIQTDSAEWALMNVAPWAGLRVEDFQRFRGAGEPFYLAQRKRHRFDWIVPKLEHTGGGLAVVRDTTERRLLLCCAR